MSNLIVNPEHPRVAVVNDFEQLVRCAIFAVLRIQCSAIGLRIGGNESASVDAI